MKELFLILIICLVPIPNSFACTCALPINPSTAIDDAEYSFLGVVTNIEKEDGWQTITFDIKDPIKGNLNQTHILNEQIVGNAACGVDYEMNRLYFVNQHKIVQNDEWTASISEMEREPRTPDVKTDSCTTEQLGGMGIFTGEAVFPELNNEITANSNEGKGLTMGLILVVALVIATFCMCSSEYIACKIGLIPTDPNISAKDIPTKITDKITRDFRVFSFFRCFCLFGEMIASETKIENPTETRNANTPSEKLNEYGIAIPASMIRYAPPHTPPNITRILLVHISVNLLQCL